MLLAEERPINDARSLTPIAAACLWSDPMGAADVMKWGVHPLPSLRGDNFSVLCFVIVES